MIIRTENPQALLANFFEKLPKELNLEYPLGDKRSQIKNLIEFVLEHYKGLNINEMHRAFRLNDSNQYPKHIESYGKIDRAFIGAVFSEFQTWRAKKRSVQNQALDETKDADKLLYHDLRNIQNSGNFNVTQDVGLKYEWLRKNERAFDSVIDQAKLKQYTGEHEAKIEVDENHWFGDWVGNPDPQVLGLDQLQSEMITEFLKGKIKH